MIQKNIHSILKMLRHEIFSNSLQEAFKENEMDFTRTRKQSFSTTLLFMMNLLSKSLSIEIENFVDQLRNSCNVTESKSFTKSAFVQYRKKISCSKLYERSTSIPYDH